MDSSRSLADRRELHRWLAVTDNPPIKLCISRAPPDRPPPSPELARKRGHGSEPAARRAHITFGAEWNRARHNRAEQSRQEQGGKARQRQGRAGARTGQGQGKGRARAEEAAERGVGVRKHEKKKGI